MLDYRGMFDGKMYVIDWKSSKRHYPEMRYQVAAYRSTFRSDIGQITHDIQGHGVLRLDKDTGKPDWKDHSATYEHDLRVFNTMVELYYLTHPRLAKAAGWKEDV